MESKLNKLLSDKSADIDTWMEIINRHNQKRYSYNNVDSDELGDLTIAAANAFGEISDLFFAFGNFKDQFDNSKFSLNLYGFSLVIKSEKTDCTYKFGIDEKGIFLNTYLKHANNIRYMDDTFWQDILSLSNFGQFVFDEYGSYSKSVTEQYPELFKNKSSNIFRLLRNYFVDIAGGEKYVNVGTLEIRWTPEEAFPSIIKNACFAFKTLYKLNYSLWKIDDVNTKKDKNKSLRKGGPHS